MSFAPARERRAGSTRGIARRCGRCVAGLAGPCCCLRSSPAVLGRDVLLDWDRLQIEAERARRLAQPRGMPLAGTPDLAALDRRLTAARRGLGAPVFIRIFKREFELELWMKRDERFERSPSIPICRWSGGLGPSSRKATAGARGLLYGRCQSPQPDQPLASLVQSRLPQRLRPQPSAHRHRYLMVHGGCGSVGCYAMTDPVIDEIWRLVTAALKGPAALPRARLPVPHDGGEHGAARARGAGRRSGETSSAGTTCSRTRVPPRCPSARAAMLRRGAGPQRRQPRNRQASA